MRIMFLIGSLTGGGTEKVVSMLANDMVSLGIAVNVVTFSSNSTDFFPLSSRVQRYPIGGLVNSDNIFSTIFWNLVRVVRIRRVINKTGPTLVLAFLPQTNVLALLATVGKHCSVIVSERNRRNAENLSWMWRSLRKWTYPHASVVTVNSVEMKEILERELRGSVQLIDNPVELPNFPICRIRREKLLISVGRLVPQKGYDLLIGAFQSSLFQHDDWKLVVLGEGKDRASLEALVLERGLDRQVSLPGIVKSIEEWYRIASLFILTSRYEGTPNAALEAMANEIPILITNTCGEMPNIVQDKVNGLVAERSESKVREKLDWAYENQPLMAGIGRAGRGTVQKYERKAVAKKWLDLIIRVS